MSNITTHDPKYHEDKEHAHQYQHHLDSSSSASKSKSESPNHSTLGSKSSSRVIEIPVQHFHTTAGQSPSASASTFLNQTGSRSSPLNAAERNDDFKSNFNTFPSFNNSSSLFDNYQSPFDLLNRRPFVNRGEASANNIPFSAHFGGADADDFFNQSTDRLFGRNSPLKDHLGASSHQRQASNSPARYGQADSTLNAPHASTSSSSTSTRQSPLNVNTDSPAKRYTTQTTIQPNHSPNSSSGSTKIGVEIPITHVASSSPSKSYSDFQHPKTVPSATESGGVQHSTTPTRNAPANETAAKMGNSSSGAKKTQAANYDNSDFATPINKPAATTAPQQASQPKTDEEKCNDIEQELNGLEKDVVNFAGTRTSDRSFLKLEEMITRCLLKLDAIERGEERINQTRRRLINFAHQLSDRLESKAVENESKAQQNDSSSTESNEPPASKRSKSPNGSAPNDS